MAASAAAIVAACSTSHPNADPTKTTPPTPSPGTCGTPNDGCSCDDPGQVVDCGSVHHTGPDGYVVCQMGHRTCLNRQWSSCVGDGDTKLTTYSIGGAMTSKSLHTLSLGDAGACADDPDGGFNPCDPYCSRFIDTPVGLSLGDGGLTIVDGGLTIDPGADGGALVAGTFTSAPGGASTCSGVTNLGGTTCTFPGLSQCRQDFHCDPTTSKCLWSGGDGYSDTTAGGIDLTVGTPCGPSGDLHATVPVCNRGTTTVPAGSPITFHVSGTQPDPCTTLPVTESAVFAQALDPGMCTSFVIGNSPGNKFIAINAGSPPGVTEPAGRCANNVAGYKTDGAAGCAACGTCVTGISGKVYDPSGASGNAAPDGANTIPLAGVAVFQPSGALKTLTDGVACDTCASLSSPYQAATVTAPNGSFTLTGISPGANVPITVQSGRWRRTISMNVPQCVTTPVTAGVLRLPRSSTASGLTDGLESTIPKTAITSGNQESLACLLRRMGVAQAEIDKPSANKRFSVYLDTGMAVSGAPSVTNLYTNQASLDAYNAILMNCNGSDKFTPNATILEAGSFTTTQRNLFVSYANKGGRMFMDHWPGNPLIKGSPNTTWKSTQVATWLGTSDTGNHSTKANARQGQAAPANATALQATFTNWLTNAASANSPYAADYIRVDDSVRFPTAVGAHAIEWLRTKAYDTNWNGSGADSTLSFSFETGIGAANGGVDTTCDGTPTGGSGRVMYNSIHVSASRGTSGNFPGSCNGTGTGPTAEEKTLEYQLFQLTACQLGGAVVPPPPPPTMLPSVVFSRDYQATCGPGTAPRWEPFYWEAIIPTGVTKIAFSAGTADTQAALPADPTSAGVKPVGTATTTVTAPAWDCEGCPSAPVAVDYSLRNDPPAPNGPSQQWLRVFMSLVPDNTSTPFQAPTLTSWRQVYDCVPNE